MWVKRKSVIVTTHSSSSLTIPDVHGVCEKKTKTGKESKEKGGRRCQAKGLGVSGLMGKIIPLSLSYCSGEVLLQSVVDSTSEYF